MLKIRRPLGRLIFNMGIAIPGKTVFLIETAPWLHWIGQRQLQDEMRNIQIWRFGGTNGGTLEGWHVPADGVALCSGIWRWGPSLVPFQYNDDVPPAQAIMHIYYVTAESWLGVAFCSPTVPCVAINQIFILIWSKCGLLDCLFCFSFHKMEWDTLAENDGKSCRPVYKVKNIAAGPPTWMNSFLSVRRLTYRQMFSLRHICTQVVSLRVLRLFSYFSYLSSYWRIKTN